METQILTHQKIPQTNKSELKIQTVKYGEKVEMV